MFSTSSLTAVAAAFLLSSSALAQNLGRPLLFNDGLSPHVDASFWANLSPTQSTTSDWAWGWIPQRCFEEANSNKVSPYDMEVFNVRYTDCGSSWVFCRHHSATLSKIDMVDLFGRLPVHERQWVQHVIAVPGGGSAYMSAGVTVYQGPVGAPSVFQHETGHAVDFYKTSGGASSTTAFHNAVAADTCVPDAYSNSNYAEDYTQVSVLALYEIVNPGGLDPIGANWRCLQNQKNTLDGFQRDAMVPGGTCSRRWADSAIVSMGPASGNGKRRVVGPKPAPGPQVGEPNVFAIPFLQKSPVTTYKNLYINETEKAQAGVRQAKWAKIAERANRIKRFDGADSE